MGKIKILYAEDDRYVADIVRNIFVKAGFEVMVVFDGQEAIDKYASFNPDLLLLDVEMPVKNGYEVATYVRAHNLHIQIVFYSYKTEELYLRKGLDSGGNVYFLKSFSEDALLLQIKKILGIDDSRIFRFGHSSYDPLLREIRVNGDSVFVLKNIEGVIFTLFCEHKNQIITREQLIEEGWHNNSKACGRQLDKYICLFRKILEPDSLIKFETLKTIGYRFIVSKNE